MKSFIARLGRQINPFREGTSVASEDKKNENLVVQMDVINNALRTASDAQIKAADDITRAAKLLVKMIERAA